MTLDKLSSAVESASTRLSTTPARLVTAPFTGRKTSAEVQRITQKMWGPIGNAVLVIPGAATLYLLYNNPQKTGDGLPVSLGKATLVGLTSYAALTLVSVLLGGL